MATVQPRSSACSSSDKGRRAPGPGAGAASGRASRLAPRRPRGRDRRGAARRLGARSGLYVPLVAAGRPIGVIVARDQGAGHLTDADLRLAETFAPRAAVAVASRPVSPATRFTGSIREQEPSGAEARAGAARPHQTGQELTSVLLGLKAVEEARSDEERAEALAAVREQVVGTLHDVRRLAVELRPKALDDTSASSRRSSTYATRSRSRPGCASTWRQTSAIGCQATSDRALSDRAGGADGTIVKHAQARAVSIVLARSGHAVTAVIEDDGRGFTTGDRSDGLGLLGMGEPLALLGGELKLESSPGAGTTIGSPRFRCNERNEMIRVLIVDDHAVVRSRPAQGARVRA